MKIRRMRSKVPVLTYSKELHRQQAARANGNREREQFRATIQRGLLFIAALAFGLEIPQ